MPSCTADSADSSSCAFGGVWPFAIEASRVHERAWSSSGFTTPGEAVNGSTATLSACAAEAKQRTKTKAPKAERKRSMPVRAEH